MKEKRHTYTDKENKIIIKYLSTLSKSDAINEIKKEIPALLHTDNRCIIEHYNNIKAPPLTNEQIEKIIELHKIYKGKQNECKIISHEIKNKVRNFQVRNVIRKYERNNNNFSLFNVFVE